MTVAAPRSLSARSPADLRSLTVCVAAEKAEARMVMMNRISAIATSTSTRVKPDRRRMFVSSWRAAGVSRLMSLISRLTPAARRYRYCSLRNSQVVEVSPAPREKTSATLSSTVMLLTPLTRGTCTSRLITLLLGCVTETTR